MTTQEAARLYFHNINALRAGKINADQHRAENRRLIDAIGEAEWEHAKAIAVCNDQRVLGY